MFDHFAKHQGQHFALLLSDGSELQTELVEVRALPAPAHADRTPFSLLFKGPAAPLLPQQIYRLRQPLAAGETAADELEIFIVPVRADASGVHYEAVFS
jgi:hypothetical protein